MTGIKHEYALEVVLQSIINSPKTLQQISEDVFIPKRTLEVYVRRLSKIGKIVLDRNKWKEADDESPSECC